MNLIWKFNISEINKAFVLHFDDFIATDELFKFFQCVDIKFILNGHGLFSVNETVLTV